MGYSHTGTTQELINLNSMGVPKADIIDYSYKTDYLNADGNFNYSNIGGSLRRKVAATIKKKDERREQRVDDRTQARVAKKQGTADKRSSEKVLAEAALASTKQTTTKKSAPKTIGMSKNAKIGLVVVGGIILIGIVVKILKNK